MWTVYSLEVHHQILNITSHFVFLSTLIVYEDGKVCISILHAPGNDAMSGETADERWRPILGVEAILLSVISIMNDPNINSPANIDASV